ncbi:hypothetical protein [Streptomyces sp. NPDC088184]|uniref:hypothetical protein n=1 Tax=unclassified Streptomyces TaxID=2593676 RepID=UPI003435E283
MSRGARLAAHGAVSAALARCDDRALGELVDAAEPLGSGIGGKSALLEIAGTRVFVKRVPLTDLERQPEGVRSTANLFGLPLFCQYGIGGPGFGAWRELATHIMTTDWALAGEYEGFPLMYHWRVLPDSTPLPEELADVDRAVAYWGGGSQVRHRIEALRQASASVALSREEAEFFDRHRSYDRCYTTSHLVNWLVTAVHGYGRDDREARVRAYARGERSTGFRGPERTGSAR